MTKYIEIEADTNDGDYVSKRSKITDKELQALEPVIQAIKNCESSHNWETGDMEDNDTPELLYVDTKILTDKQVNLFNKYTPDSEYGIHTIESIIILHVEKEKKLL